MNIISHIENRFIYKKLTISVSAESSSDLKGCKKSSDGLKIREHEGLNGKTPSEACGIEIKGKNKWITLIQNASHN